MESPLISCERVSIRYGDRYAVKNATFAVREGDFLCVAGKNGSGKTTLMGGLLGLVRPCEGTIHRRGANGIGYLPQQHSVRKDFPATAGEVVMSGFAGASTFFCNKRQKTRANIEMDRLGVSEFKKRQFAALSGGQQKRALLARAMCAADKILMLDEPEAGLDSAGAAELLETVRSLNAGGLTVVMITHDIEMAMQYSSKILLMDTTPVFFGPPGDMPQTTGKTFGKTKDKNA